MQLQRDQKTNTDGKVLFSQHLNTNMVKTTHSTFHKDLKHSARDVIIKACFAATGPRHFAVTNSSVYSSILQ